MRFGIVGPLVESDPTCDSSGNMLSRARAVAWGLAVGGSVAATTFTFVEASAHRRKHDTDLPQACRSQGRPSWRVLTEAAGEYACDSWARWSKLLYRWNAQGVIETGSCFPPVA